MTKLHCTFLLLGLLGAIAGCAGQPPATTGAARAVPPTAEPALPRPCLRETNGRLPATERCLAASGVVLTREELDRTGAVPLGEAVRRRVPF